MKTLIPRALIVAALCAVVFQLTPKTYAQHGLLREVYTDLAFSGTIDALTTDPNFPNNPASVTVVSEFEAPDSFGDFYGQRIRGFVEAPQTGAYIFWISSDDQSQLFLSSDERPENKTKIAEVFNWTQPRTWDTEPNQRSAPIRLEQGKRYYIEALMVEGSGADHISVRWQLPDGTIEEPIPNNRLYVELTRPQIARQPANVSVTEGQPATFTVQLANRGPVNLQWFRNDVALPGETNLSLTLPSTSVSDSGSRFTVRASNDFDTNGVVSFPAFLTVNRDVTPPTILGAQTGAENDLVTVTFSEPMDPVSAGNVANYTILGDARVLSATLDAQGTTVILQTTPLTPGQSYTLLINDVLDRAKQGNAVEPDSTADFRFGFAPLDPLLVYGKPERPGASSRRTGLTFSEIMYHPAPRTTDARVLEFIEIHNSEEAIETIGGYRITGVVEYTFPAGTFIPARGYLVVAAAPIDVQSVYGLPKVFGPYTNRLAQSGPLKLLNDQGAVLLDMHYDSNGDWPSAPDGAGPSLVLARPSYGEADPRAWAASQVMGGTPGAADIFTQDAFSGVVINEFLAHTDLPQIDFIELYNYGTQEVDLSGAYLTDDISTNKFQIPAGTKIAPLGFVAFDEIDLGFALSSGGERIILRNRQKTRIIDTIKFDAQANGVSMGRYPDGAPRFRQLATPTLGRANSRPLMPAVVVNEIMYNPISRNQNEEYVELFNRSGTPANLSGWRLSGGISFTFPQNTVLGPGAYLVVAKDVGLLRTNHPGALTTANSLGDFSGNLSNGGDRVVLDRPELAITTNGTQRATNVLHVLVDEVKYGTGGRWPKWADGGGSSMELIDPNADNDEPSNWADSDETQKSSWVTIERRGILDNGPTNFPAATPTKNLHVLMMGAGEALLDNVAVFRDGGTNLVSNPGVENGATDWLFGGTHDLSTVEAGVGRNGGSAVHIRATDRGDTSANRVRVRLTGGITNGSIATLRADVRWLRGDPEILLRLHGNYLEAPGVMPVPKNLGTPGAPNSRSIANSGPAITRVQHSPLLPPANQPVTVIARVDDPDRVALAVLNYRIDPSSNYVRVPMSYNGAGFFSAVVPGQSNSVKVAFYLEALDARGALARFPATAPANEGVILFGDTTPEGNFASYRLWLTSSNINRWARREKSSNEALDATFVYNNERVVYNMGTYYSGSPFHWQGYNSPLGNGANYIMSFPDDDRFLGQNDFVLNLPSNIASDGTGVREQVFFWMADQMNQPFSHRRYHHLYINGQNRDFGLIFEDAQQPNADMIEEWFPDATGGDLHKIEDWFEYTDSFGFFNQDAELIGVWTTNVTTGLPELKQERYRWWFRKRAVNDSAHNYTNLLQLVKAVNNPNTEQFVAETQALVDIDEWMGAIALRHAAGDWDAFGYRRGKNMYAYKPPGGKWQLMHWDIAFSFGLGDGPTRDLFDVGHFGGSVDPIDTITKRMMDTPVFRRAYYRALYNAVNGPFISSRVNPVIDAKSTALLANAVGAEPPDTVKQWIATRRDYIIGQLGAVSSGFSITSSSGYSTNRNTAIIRGNAPVNVTSIRVNGADYPVNWTSETTWEIRLALKPQLNTIKAEGFDASGNLVGDSTATINVTTQPEAIAGRVVINEIQYNPAAPGSEFIELYNSARITSYDLSGYRLNGLDFVFPAGSVITPGGFLVVAKDAAAFGEQYGFTIPLAGQFTGRFQDGGETISLVSPGTNGVVLSSVRYDSAAPWPALANGTGASLQLIDPSQDASRVGNWTAVSGTATPGATNSVRTTVQAYPLVWLNELAPSNAGGKTDSAGERDPWVELYNSGSAPLSLSGLYLTDDYANLAKWAFPAGATLAAGQRALVWLDGQPTQSTASEWHTSFRINPTSGTLALVGTQGGGLAVFDYLTYDQVPAGQSYGAFPEGQASLRSLFTQASPGASNSLSAPAVRVFINEWMASNSTTIQDPSDLHFDDWFELYNAGSETADLSGYSFSDSIANPGKFTIPQGTTIPAHGYLLVWADSDQATNGQLHVNFKLSTSGDTIVLLAPDGSVVDNVTFGAQQSDVSEGRTSDGGTQTAKLPVATPGAPNSGIDPSLPHFTAATVSGGNINLTWASQPGQNYKIQVKNSLSDATWTDLKTVTATGTTTSLSDSASGTQRFYRLVK